MQSILSAGYVKDTGTPKGRGVFASRALRAGEVVEVCPVLLLHVSFDKLPDEIRRVVFNWSKLANMTGVHALALGYGSMYNHANPANVRYEASEDGAYLRLVATEAIGCDSELTINYNAIGGGTRSESDDWFRSVQVTPYEASPNRDGG